MDKQKENGKIENPIDVSKEEFRIYLTKNGVLDSFTKVLMKCYNEAPEDPVTFIKENVSVTLKQKMIVEEWKKKIREVDQEIERLEAELEIEKAKLLQQQTISENREIQNS